MTARAPPGRSVASELAMRLELEPASTHLVLGGAVSFAESIDTVALNIREIAPTFFVGVPRIYEKLQQGFLFKLGESGGTKVSAAYQLALDLVRTRYDPGEVEPGVPPPAGPAWTAFLDRFTDAYRDELAAFLRLASGDGESACTARDGLEALRVAVAATRSLHQHRPVRLSEVQ